MPLQTGDTAPFFTLSTLTSEGPKLLSLAEQIGKKHTLLLFVPMAFTGVCTQEMCSVSQGLDAYTDLDATVWGISGDNPFAQDAWAKKDGITIPLLSDYEHTVARDYGVAYDSFLPALNLPMGGVAKRSAFLIDKAGIIQYAEVLEDARELPNFAAIQACLADLK